VANQVFIVGATAHSVEVAKTIAEKHFGNFFELKPDTWFISFDGTTRQLAEDIGIRSGESGSGVVAPLTGFSGRASKDVWDWLRVNWPSNG
jgi:hypothetical protein